MSETAIDEDPPWEAHDGDAGNGEAGIEVAANPPNSAEAWKATLAKVVPCVVVLKVVRIPPGRETRGDPRCLLPPVCVPYSSPLA